MQVLPTVVSNGINYKRNLHTCTELETARQLKKYLSFVCKVSSNLGFCVKKVVLALISQNLAHKRDRKLSCPAKFNIYKKSLIDTYHFHDDQCLGRTCTRASNLTRFYIVRCSKSRDMKSRDGVQNVKLTFLITKQFNNRMLAFVC